MSIYSVDKLIAEARKLAAEYRRATGESLGGVSNEIAKHDAVKLLHLELTKAGGYDAVGTGKRAGKRIQIKGRVIFEENKPGYRIGQIKLEQEWDSIVLVIMDKEFNCIEIHEAQREQILAALSQPSSTQRAKRGALSVAKFKIIGHLVWTREEGEITDELRENR